MDWTTSVAVHESASPEFTRERILNRLKQGELDASLLYGGLRQTLKWIALHEAFSPARIDADGARIYEEAFHGIAEKVRGNVAHVVGLACGDGTKDRRCLEILRENGRAVIYTPADISLGMVLTAHRNLLHAIPGLQCTPLICDLSRCSVLPAILKNFDPSGAERIILFLGTIHNYWPPEILRPILFPLRPQDHFLLGANLLPSENHDVELRRILLQYDNQLTRDWLMGALSELEITPDEGKLFFSLQEADRVSGLKRIQADFLLRKEKSIRIFGQEIRLGTQPLRVFFSYRFTQQHIQNFLEQAGLSIVNKWITVSGEEGLFLCQRAPGTS